MAAPPAAELAQLPFFEPACAGLRKGVPTATLASMFETDELLISAIKAEFVKPAADEAGPSSSPSSSPKGKSYADVAAAAAATKPDAPPSSPKVSSPASGKVS